VIPYETLNRFYEAAKNGGRKSIPLDELNPVFEIEYNYNGILNYLKVLNTYVKYKENDNL
jgi:penicillin-binding protein-related factor A (putative recombinase)